MEADEVDYINMRIKEQNVEDVREPDDSEDAVQVWGVAETLGRSVGWLPRWAD